jgi:hypothetical protein
VEAGVDKIPVRARVNEDSDGDVVDEAVENQERGWRLRVERGRGGEVELVGGRCTVVTEVRRREWNRARCHQSNRRW